MARRESDREDLLREATALVERIELAPAEAGIDDHIVIGFRAEGAMSIFFGADVVYQFNSSGQLRRAFCDGMLLKAERGRLVSMQRVRQANEVQLLRHDMSDDEQAEFLASMSKRLRDLVEQCGANMLVTVGQVPHDAAVLSRVLSSPAICDEVQIAKSPHAR